MNQSERPSPGFWKTLINLKAAAALHVIHYNVGRLHGSLKNTSALRSGVAIRLWNLSDLFGQAA
jgi:hypothetical protein